MIKVDPGPHKVIATVEKMGVADFDLKPGKLNDLKEGVMTDSGLKATIAHFQSGPFCLHRGEFHDRDEQSG